jgi:hypothetical protein
MILAYLWIPAVIEHIDIRELLRNINDKAMDLNGLLSKPSFEKTEIKPYVITLLKALGEAAEKIRALAPPEEDVDLPPTDASIIAKEVSYELQKLSHRAVTELNKKPTERINKIRELKRFLKEITDLHELYNQQFKNKESSSELASVIGPSVLGLQSMIAHLEARTTPPADNQFTFPNTPQALSESLYRAAVFFNPGLPSRPPWIPPRAKLQLPTRTLPPKPAPTASKTQKPTGPRVSQSSRIPLQEPTITLTFEVPEMPLSQDLGQKPE